MNTEKKRVVSVTKTKKSYKYRHWIYQLIRSTFCYFKLVPLGSENMEVAIVGNWDQQGMLKIFPGTIENAYLIFYSMHL